MAKRSRLPQWVRSVQHGQAAAILLNATGFKAPTEAEMAIIERELGTLGQADQATGKRQTEVR